MALHGVACRHVALQLHAVTWHCSCIPSRGTALACRHVALQLHAVTWHCTCMPSRGTAVACRHVALQLHAVVLAGIESELIRGPYIFYLVPIMWPCIKTAFANCGNVELNPGAVLFIVVTIIYLLLQYLAGNDTSIVCLTKYLLTLFSY